tara:strand:- start:99 stop:785 length:687 start_codon:yes stop_codon:yes gene_type:complete
MSIETIRKLRHRFARQRLKWQMVDTTVETMVATKTAKTAKTYKKLEMFDFDGTLFRSWEKEPKWWGGTHLDDGPYSFFVRPESLDEPCVPSSPDGSYWISKVVSAAQKASSDRNTFVVVVTGRVKTHRNRILDLLKSKGIRPNASYFNPGMAAAKFKIAVLRNLLISLNTIDEVVIWENENMKAYENALNTASRVLGRDIKVTVHAIHVPPEPLKCEPEDFGLPSERG